MVGSAAANIIVALGSKMVVIFSLNGTADEARIAITVLFLLSAIASSLE
jgi:hypothetical protein